MKITNTFIVFLVAIALTFGPTSQAVAGDARAESPSYLWSYGSNSNGRSGQGTATGSTLVPTQVGTDFNWIEISAGSNHSLAIKDDGTLWSFGANNDGQTGQGTTTGSTLVPTQVGSDTDWVSVSAGSAHSLALKEDGTLWSFGSHSLGRTGLGLSSGNATTPTQVGLDTDWTEISAGPGHSLALKEDGTLWGFGTNQYGRNGLGLEVGDTLTPTQAGSDTDWTAISAGGSHSLALKADESLWSFGYNDLGKTGQGTTTGSTVVPTQVGSDTDWTAISAGTSHSLTIKADGTLWSFGQGSWYQTGQGSPANISTPTQVGSDTDWTLAAAGSQASAALKEDGTLWSFGTNTSGQTGQGTATGNFQVPTQIGSDIDWTAVAAGTSYALVLKFAVIQPTISTVGSADITQTSAELRGEMLTAGNVPKDGWGFNYGTTDSYGSSIAGVSTLRNPGVFSLFLEDVLECGTLYHFQAYVTTSGGDVLGDDDTFTTADCPSTVSPGGSNGGSGSSSGGSTSIKRQYEIFIEQGEFEKAQNLKNRWPSLFAGEAQIEVPVSETTDATEAMIELVKKNLSVFEQAKTLGIVLPEFIETLIQQARQTLLVRDLELYMEGDDVFALQQLLNQNGYALAAEGQEGSHGNETKYFGPRTQAALAGYQQAVGIAPAAGYFGPVTRSYMKNAGILGVWW